MNLEKAAKILNITLYILGPLLFIILFFGSAFHFRDKYERLCYNAENYINKTKYEKALVELSKLPHGDVLNKAELLEIAKNGFKHKQAERLTRNKQYDAAIKIYETLEDGENYINKVKYLAGLDKYNNKEYEDAYGIFCSISNYKDTYKYLEICREELMPKHLETLYIYTKELEQQGKYEEALENYELLSKFNYKDSLEKFSNLNSTGSGLL